LHDNATLVEFCLGQRAFRWMEQLSRIEDFEVTCLASSVALERNPSVAITSGAPLPDDPQSGKRE
jgi:hypothetical protein